MRSIVRIIAAFTFLFVVANVYAQTNTPADQAKANSQCYALKLPAISSTVKINLKDGRKLKGKLASVRDNNLEVIHDKKTELIPCTGVAKIKRTYSFGHHFRYVTGVTVMITGLIVASPGLLIAEAGAKHVGFVIATPGILIAVLGYEIADTP